MKPIKRYEMFPNGDEYDFVSEVEDKNGEWVKHSDVMERVKALKEKIMKQKETYVKEGYDAGANDGLMCSIQLLDKYFPEEEGHV